LARTFPEWAEKAKKAKKILEKRTGRPRRERLRKALATLHGLLDEITREQQQPRDPLWIRPKTPEDIAAMGLGLALFERWIEHDEKHVAELNLFQLRVSRKSKGTGQFAAIGRLADEVQRVTGEAHYEEIADLAGVILRTEIFPEQVRRAAPPRRAPHLQWVKPKLHTATRSRTK